MEAEEGWQDVTDLLRRGAASLPKDDILISSSLPLWDAMGAIKIGDPRMDMGAEVPSDLKKEPFEPTRILLPEEVILVIDRALACEMTWHTGHSLSQTIYTCLYLHDLTALAEISAPLHGRQDVVPGPSSGQPTGDREASAPPELTSLVLRAYMLGLAKCVDAVWEELIRGSLYENEDINTNKAGVQLYEDTPVDDALTLLDKAYDWLDRWREDSSKGLRIALMERLRFRIEYLYSLSLFYGGPQALLDFPAHATSALAGLRNAVPAQMDTLNPGSASVVDSVFDDSIARRLATEMPPRPMTMMMTEEAHGRAQDLLHNLLNVVDMSRSRSVFEWQAYFEHFSRRTEPSPPFVRSLLVSCFCSDNIVAIDPTCTRTLRTVGQHFVRTTTGWDGDFTTTGEEVQRLVDLLAGNFVAYFSTLAANRPRARRKLGDLIPQWRDLHSTATMLTLSAQSGIGKLPSAVLYMLLSIVLEVMWSGFDLELYDEAEFRPMWWVIIRLLEVRGTIAKELADSLGDESGARDELKERSQWDDVMCRLTRTSLHLTFVSGEATSHLAHSIAEANFNRRMRFLAGFSYPGQPPKPPLLPRCPPLTFEAFMDWQNKQSLIGRTQAVPSVFEDLRLARAGIDSLATALTEDRQERLLPGEYELDIRAMRCVALKLAQRANASEAPISLPPAAGRERVFRWFDIE